MARRSPEFSRSLDGGALSGLADKGATNPNATPHSARDFRAEVVELLHISRGEKAKEVAYRRPEQAHPVASKPSQYMSRFRG